MRIVVPALLVACSSSAPLPMAPPAPPGPAPIVPVDAMPPDASPDAGIAADAPAWIFRYATPARTETWKLQLSGGVASIDVTSATGTTVHYWGTATDALAIDVATSAAKIHLDCKKVSKHVSARCNDAKAPASDALDCYVEGFKEPMTFGLAPGIEFVQDKACTGYRQIR